METALQQFTQTSKELASGDSKQLITVSLIVPVFNEKDCVASLLSSLVEADALLGEKFQFEFILVDDASTDGTPELLEAAIQEKPHFRVVRHEKNLGIAGAIYTGICCAKNEVVASIDADGSYDVSLLEQMVPLLRDEVDCVTASPYHARGSVENVPWWRLWLSRRASALYRLGMRTKLACYTSCFRVYRRSKVLPLAPENAGYVGVAELLWNLDRQGSKIVEHPAVLRTRVAGYSKMRIFRSSLNHLRLITHILKYRLKSNQRL